MPVSNALYLDDDCSIISAWTDSDSGTGVSSQITFDGRSCFKFDTGATPAGAPDAQRVIDVGTFGDRVVISLSLCFYALGTRFNGDYFRLQASHSSAVFHARFGSDGLTISDGLSHNIVGSYLVEQNTWQEWTFDIDFSVATTANVDVYLNGVLQDNVDCSWTTSSTNGRVELAQLGYVTANRITYVDWIKIGDDLVYVSSIRSAPTIGGTAGGSRTEGTLPLREQDIGSLETVRRE